MFVAIFFLYGLWIEEERIAEKYKTELTKRLLFFFFFFSRQNGKRPSRNLLHLEIPDVQLQISKTIYRLDKQIPPNSPQKRNDNQNS